MGSALVSSSLIVAAKICLSVKGFAPDFIGVPPLTRKFLAAVEELSWRRLVLQLGKEVTLMIRFHVFVYTPAVFELEAENEREAERKAVALYVKEHGAWIDPKVGLPPTIDIWRIPEVYKGKSMCELGTCDCERGKCICCQ